MSHGKQPCRAVPTQLIRPRLCRPAAEAPHAAGLKRKKTVTWADGEDVHVDSEGEELEADDDARGAAAQEGPGPGVVVVPLAADPLFAGMDEAALQQQVEVAKSEGEALDRPRLLRRRL